MGKANEIRVLVIDDDYFARSDLVGRLARHSRIRVVGEAASPKAALELLRSKALDAGPDVVLLDLAYEDAGFRSAEFLPELRALLPDAKVLGLSVREDEGLALDAIRAGVHGVLWKNEVRGRICRAVIRLHGNGCVFTPGVAQHLLGKVGPLPGRAQVIEAPEGRWLTPRLEQVARLWCEVGMTAREIADELHLSEQTVRGYIKEIYQVLGVADDDSAAARRQQAYEARAGGES